MNQKNIKLDYIYYEYEKKDNTNKLADETLKFIRNEDIPDYDYISVLDTGESINVVGTVKSIEKIKELIEPKYFGGEGWYEDYEKLKNYSKKSKEIYNVGRKYNIEENLIEVNLIEVNVDENEEDKIVNELLDTINKELIEISDKLSEFKNIL